MARTVARMQLIRIRIIAVVLYVKHQQPSGGTIGECFHSAIAALEGGTCDGFEPFNGEEPFKHSEVSLVQ